MKYILSVLFSLIAILGFGQKGDAVLFSVDNIDVTVEEFRQIYEKTNGDKASYSKESLDEYLNLYVHFKLKVKKAYDMGLGEDQDLMRELDGYRNQLASSYLTDKEIKDKLISEVYNRQKTDVEVRHILFPINKGNLPSDTLKAYNRATSVLHTLNQGVDFAELAEKHSGDRSTYENGGYIGYISAMLPNGFYNIENAIYNNPVGSIVGPVRSAAGYHLLKIEKNRPARGKMEIAHILVVKKEDPALAKKTITEIYGELIKGKNFSIICADRSEDEKTAKKGGYIGMIKIGDYSEAFENAAFSLEKDNEFSKPVESSIGWHIIQRIGKKENVSLKDSYRFIESQVMRDQRFGRAEEALVARVKKDSKIDIKQKEFDTWVNSALDSTLLTYKWSAPKDRPLTTIVEFDGGVGKYTIKDYIFFLMKSARKRVELGRLNSITQVSNILMEDFINDMCVKYEESKLESKYPEFARLMQEYKEGILLFEATKENVWDKASEDTTGVQKYFDAHMGDYIWKERAEVIRYTIYTSDPKVAQKVHASAKTDTQIQLEMRYNQNNKSIVKGVETVLEKNKKKELVGMAWNEGAVSAPAREGKNTYKFHKLVKILPAGQKTLAESRGYVVADYQDQLEQKWITELKKNYKVKINKSVLKSMTKG